MARLEIEHIGPMAKGGMDDATVSALRLSDDPDALAVRSYLLLAGWLPPKE